MFRKRLLKRNQLRKWINIFPFRSGPLGMTPCRSSSLPTSLSQSAKSWTTLETGGRFAENAGTHYQSTWHHIPDETYLHQQRWENLKFCMFISTMHNLWARSWGPPSLLYNEYRVFPGGKVAKAWRSPTPSNAEVKERVQLYLYSPLGIRSLF